MSDGTLCEDCPPADYPTDKTRCAPCPRRKESPMQSDDDRTKLAESDDSLVAVIREALGEVYPRQIGTTMADHNAAIIAAAVRAHLRTPARHGEASAAEVAAIEGLLQLAYAVWCTLDDSEELQDGTHLVDNENFQALCKAMVPWTSSTTISPATRWRPQPRRAGRSVASSPPPRPHSRRWRVAKPKRKAWTMPPELEPYREFICNTGGLSVEELMTRSGDSDCNVIINAPLALMCQSVESQIILLRRLHANKMLANKEPKP